MNKLAVVFGVLFVLVAAFVVFQDSSVPVKENVVSEASIDQLQFAELAAQNTNQCRGPEFLSFESGEGNLQGSCCSPMDFHRYQEQLEGLKKYAVYDKIPDNPYDVSVSLARELLAYRDRIQLSLAQQAVYDKAVKTSDEGGPCCCKCWRWYAFEGLAKYLIVEEGFDSAQVADVWDLLDGCGGSGHVHGDAATHRA